MLNRALFASTKRVDAAAAPIPEPGAEDERLIARLRMARAKTGSKLYATAAARIQALTNDDARINKQAQHWRDQWEAAEARVAELVVLLRDGREYITGGRYREGPTYQATIAAIDAALARAAPTRGDK
jgi:hypothetical protein